MRSPIASRHLRSRGPLAVLVAWVLLLSVPGTAAASPSDDPFYDPPAPLPSGQPGDVIEVRSSTFTLDPVLKAPVPGITSRQVLYHSTDAQNQPIAVSGTVLVPDAPWWGFGSRPIVTYSVGTRGLGDDCAPSHTLTQGTDYEGLFIKAALSKGWAVAVTDYQGLGTPGVHTYMVGPAQGHAVLDIARAAQRLPGTGLSTDSPVGIMGYSQGGSGAGWAAQQAASYAPELRVKGTVAGGVPGDLEAVADFLDGSPFVALALMTALGFDTAYPELDLSSYLNDRGHELAENSRDICLVSVDGFTTLIDTAFTGIDDYVTTNPLDTAAWQDRLQEARLGGTRPSAPVFQYHGVVDEIVPFGQAAELRRRWCDQGARVTWSVLPGEHVLGLVEGVQPGLTWMSARFAGIPTLGNCWLP